MQVPERALSFSPCGCSPYNQRLREFAIPSAKSKTVWVVQLEAVGEAIALLSMLWRHLRKRLP